ncbi:NAD-P-binding protein [Dentipellis sp. KUC8613]|nr:NAD-P-binding protein [Dentipellis sp. KUC8613]
MSAPAETLPVNRVHDVYPYISPDKHFAAQTFRGKVVFLTGASKGICLQIATFYARAGASVAITARRQKPLEEARAAILNVAPSAEVLGISVDVVQAKQVEEAIKATIARFGKIDICVAGAGANAHFDKPLAQEDPDVWWGILESNVRGVLNVAHFAVPHLSKTKGYLIVISSEGAQLRLPMGSSYTVAKHAVGRLVEYIVLENPDVKAFALHPGSIKTESATANPSFIPYLIDTLQLPAATAFYLTSGSADWLSGRFVSSNWDLGEVERDWKDKIVASQALVSRLSIPT